MKKRNLIVAVMMMISFMISGHVFSQEKKKNYLEVQIKTSAVCGMCEERIEGNIAYEKGVKKVDLDDETKIVTIGYNPRRTDPDKLRKAISKLGYDADDVEADQAAHDKLPKCCQKGNEPH